MNLNQAMICLDCDEISPTATHCPICQSKIVVQLVQWIPPISEAKPNMTRREELMAEAREMITKMTAMMIDVDGGDEPIGMCV